MAILITILVLALVVAVIFVVSAPLRAAWARAATKPVEGQIESGRLRSSGEISEPGEARLREAERKDDRIELEVAREAKYREIRDTELDYRTGKLSQEDFAATDGALRAEAVEILNSLAALDEDKPGS